MEEMLARIQRAFDLAFDQDSQPITLDTAPGDIAAWDSLGHVTLASTLEEEFRVSFDVDELMAMENVREIVRIVQAKLGGR
jgi:acyl carrier protein